MKIKILPTANNDLLNGYDFYEQQERGIGQYFLDSLFSDIDSLLIYHGVHPVFFGKYHRMLSQRFPFAIYYQIEDEDIVVCAILDCRKNPAWTKGRFE